MLLRRARAFLLPIILVLAGVVIAPRPAPAQPAPQLTLQGQQHAQAFLDRMVRVTGRQTAGGAGETGYGFVVGEGTNAQGTPVLVIVTADRLVRDPAQPDLRARPPVIVPYGNLGVSLQAELLEQRLPPAQGDLAVLLVAKPTTALFRPVPVADTQLLLPGTLAWQDGRPGQWEPPAAPGRYAVRDAAGWLTFDGLDASPGAAGAAILTEKGVAGMLVGPAPSNGAPRGQGRPDSTTVRVLPIELIAAKVQAWGFRWDLPAADGAAPSSAPGSLAALT
ncbi:hypothetical protein, partial [Limobrevibacterium gyesilva]